MSIRDEFNALRFDSAHHLGLGDIRLTIAQQEDIAARVEAAEAEVQRLRQGLWDCFREAGGDTDGNDTPDALVSDIVPLAVDCVRDLREGYDEAISLMGPLE